MKLRTCVSPEGRFLVGIHRPCFGVKNLRNNTLSGPLGLVDDNAIIDNKINFPQTDVDEPEADLIYEIANPFFFRGTTYINSAWADSHAGKPETIQIPEPSPCSLFQSMARDKNFGPEDKARLLDQLPHPLLIALAQASTDPQELTALAKKVCTILFEPGNDTPWGMGYTKKPDGKIIPNINDHEVFEVLVNNPCLPDDYKNAMVLRPGVQGKSEIMGEYLSEDGKTHVFEYLRRNSYIPWGHFASNMANDSIRYRAKDLTAQDMTGIRHLYYQRIYVRMATQLGLDLPDSGRCLSEDELEVLRKQIIQAIESAPNRQNFFNTALWGWNFGFGHAHSGHRLHASHQMIHQQNALVPGQIKDNFNNPYDCFSLGDLVTDFIKDFKKTFGKEFFKAYLEAIAKNTRTDERSLGQSSLVVFENDHVILFAPKAQVSEWELQLMTKSECSNILEADIFMRRELDHAMLTAVQVLEKLGSTMVSCVELSGRFDIKDTGQHLLYSFVPRLPYAPQTFSEAQLRWITGCYPEDFAHACRRALK